MFSWFLSLFTKLFFFTGKVGKKNGFAKKLTSTEEQKCFDLLKNPDTKNQAEELLTMHNLRLVAHISKKFESKKIDSEELISIGSIGLLKAIRTFDSEKANFSTYASRCITNEILMFFRKTKNEQCEVSLDESIGTDKDGNDMSLAEILSDPKSDVEKQIMSKIELQQLEQKVVALLDERERRVIALRFGLLGELPHTQKETAKILNISRSYVSRIETASIKKL